MCVSHVTRWHVNLLIFMYYNRVNKYVCLFFKFVFFLLESKMSNFGVKFQSFWKDLVGTSSSSL